MKSPSDKFTVIRTSCDSASIEFLTREVLDQRLHQEWWGSEPKFSAATEERVDLEAASVFYIIPDWPVQPEIVVTKTRVVLP